MLLVIPSFAKIGMIGMIGKIGLFVGFSSCRYFLGMM